MGRRRPGGKSSEDAAHRRRSGQRVRPIRGSVVAEATQRAARRNARLFTPANRFELLTREAVLRLAGWPFLAPPIKRLLNREGDRL